MTAEELRAELTAQQRSRDSLAQVLGYWLLRNTDDIYRAISDLRYMRTSPITEEKQKAAEAQLDRLSHEWNRTNAAYRMRSKDIERLTAQVRAIRALEKQ